MLYSNLYARLYVARGKASGAIRAVWRLKLARLYFFLSGLFQVLAWLQAIFIFRRVSGDILVLHYNVDFGIDLVGAPARIFYYPLAGLALFLLNFIVAAALSGQKDFRALAKLLLAASVLIGIFLCLVLLSIYFINFL